MTVGNEPSAIQQILELARWAPSGDNTQPWQFEIIDDRTFLIHATDTKDWCVYDLDGRASQIAIGALLETIEIAASDQKMTVQYSYPNTLNSPTVIKTELKVDEQIKTSRLLPFVKTRCTQRRPFTTTDLSKHQKDMLQQSVGAGYQVLWFEGRDSKWQFAKLLFKNAKVRLTIPEAYCVHKRIIEWDAQFSEDKIPDQAVGLDWLSLKSMRWAMTSWERVCWLNRYFAGTWLPRIQLDLIPALCCGAHFIIVADKDLSTEHDFHSGGKATQRFWLTASQLGLQFQPEMTPLIFSKYVTNSLEFTHDKPANKLAKELTSTLVSLLGDSDINTQVFMGRIGVGMLPNARSTRKPLQKLIK